MGSRLTLTLTARLTLLFTLGSAVVLLTLGWLVMTAIASHFDELDRDELSGKLDYAAQLWRMPLDGVAESLASGSISYWLSTRSTTGNAQWWNTSTRSRSHRPG